ncbi:unnamed protein product [Lupinus luteus]|uniref:Uncharacterized protein n=1 Tax=Lupinus luteus TaxID=3873 RepID=A0AAV1Y0E7_LUPLU
MGIQIHKEDPIETGDVLHLQLPVLGTTDKAVKSRKGKRLMRTYVTIPMVHGYVTRKVLYIKIPLVER